MKKIVSSVKEVLLSYFPSRSMLEAMMKHDFRVGEPRSNLMQLCFSNLAAWPLVVLLLLIALDPFRDSWRLVDLFSYDNSFVLFLLDGHLGPMLTFFFVFFLAEWLLRKEYLLVAIPFYFLNRGELHINLALSGVLGVYLARTAYLWWMAVDAEGETRKIWHIASGFNMAAWILTAAASLYAVDFLQVERLFGPGLSRFFFLFVVVLFFHFMAHLYLSTWGHFYARREKDPSELHVHFSTSNWILRFGMSYHLQSLLRKAVGTQLEKHEVSEKQLRELQSHSAALSKFSVGEVLQKEIRYLKEAKLRLEKI